jgi:transposase
MSENMPRNGLYSIKLSDAEKTQLEIQARKYTSPYYSVLRAKMILLAAQGQGNDRIAASLSVPRQIVSKWRKRFFEERLAGLEAEPRSGCPPVFAPRSGRAG